MKEYNTGCMPRTDYRYEEFEGLLGSFHLSLLPLKDSTKPEDQRDYQKAMEVLNGFSQKYGVQSPEEAVKNPRAEEDWGNASVKTNGATIILMGSFWRDFGLGGKPGDKDQEEQCKLGRTILSVFERYGIAQVGYMEYNGEKVPAELKEWNNEKRGKTLVEVMNE